MFDVNLNLIDHMNYESQYTKPKKNLTSKHEVLKNIMLEYATRSFDVGEKL